MKNYSLPVTAALALATALATGPLAAQGPASEGLVGTALKIRQLDGVKRVLMIGAHPDDEDTSLLTALARGAGAETAYLSLSRGEGGQNLIGPQLHEGLGIIRTGELVAARSLDGGRQFFTRAFDFGYSKNIDEALQHWPLEDVLRDVVFVVRSFRPHVIVSVFSGTVRDGHGQHQIAGVTAREAFDAAGDPSRFPELAAHGVEPWAPAKLYRSARFSPSEATVTIPTGSYDAVLGRSHFQLAMESRSQHRSQDMGVSQYMGPRQSALQLLASRATAEEDGGIFAGVDTTLVGQIRQPLPTGWPTDVRQRLERYRHLIRDAEESLSAVHVGRAVPSLMEAASILEGIVSEAPAGPGLSVLATRLAQVREVALTAGGIVTDVRVGRDLITPGEPVVVDVTVWNGGPFDLVDVAPILDLPTRWEATPTDESALGPPRSPFFRPTVPETPADGAVPAGQIARWSWEVTVPSDARISAPYFLENERTSDLYTWPADSERWALPFDPSPIRGIVAMDLARPDGARGRLQVAREGEYVGVDKASGEFREPVLVVPALDVDVQPAGMVWPTGQRGSRAVTVVLTNTAATERAGTLRLQVPDGWDVDPLSAPFVLSPDGASRSFVFEAIPTGPIPEGRHAFLATATDRQGREYTRSYDVIDYPHIRRAALFRDATVEVTAFPVVADTELRVGYIMGSGDDGAEALRQIGMEVDLLTEPRVREGDFAAYDVLVLGVRAYETRPDLVAANDDVLAFAENGGTVIVQYNKYEYPAGDFAPYPVDISRPHDRVTDEGAPVTVLEPTTPVFSGPNSVNAADFDGWVQERGLYFLGSWDEQFTPVMEMADPGEEPKRGSLVVAPTGEGLYVYTGLAFFRQFPAGVPGAYRLFANLVSMRAADWHRARTASQ